MPLNRGTHARRGTGAWLVLALAIAAPAAAAGEVAGGAKASGGNFVLEPQTVDAGGGRASGGDFVADGTIGQFDADPAQPSGGGVFALTGGFWTRVEAGASGDTLFMDGFEGPP